MVTAGGEATASGLLFDTSVVIAAFAEDTAVLDRLRRLPADLLFVPATVIGELAYGALVSSQVTKNLARLAEFAAAANTLPCDTETAHYYGEVKAHLKQIGRPIPENDVWIAAVAQQHRLTPITRDAHFEHVAGLALEHW